MSLLPTAHAGQAFGARRVDYFTVSGQVSASDATTGRVTDHDGIEHDVRLIEPSSAFAPGDTATILRIQSGPNRRSRPVAIVNHSRGVWLRASPEATSILARSGVTRTLNWWLSMLLMVVTMLAAVWPVIHTFLTEINAPMMAGIPAFDIYALISAQMPGLGGWRLETSLPTGTLDALAGLGFLPMEQLTELALYLGAAILVVLAFASRDWRLLYLPAFCIYALMLGAIFGGADATLITLAGGLLTFMLGGLVNRIRDSGRFNARVERLAEHVLRNPPTEEVRTSEIATAAAISAGGAALVASEPEITEPASQPAEAPTDAPVADATTEVVTAETTAAAEPAEAPAPEVAAETATQDTQEEARPALVDAPEARDAADAADAPPLAASASSREASTELAEAAALADTETADTAPELPEAPEDAAVEAEEATADVAVASEAEATAPVVAEPATASEDAAPAANPAAEEADTDSPTDAQTTVEAETAGTTATADASTEEADDDLPSLEEVASAAALTAAEKAEEEEAGAAIDLEDERTLPVAPPPPMPTASSAPSIPAAPEQDAENTPEAESPTPPAADVSSGADALSEQAAEPVQEMAEAEPPAALSDDPMIDADSDPMLTDDTQGDFAPGAPDIEIKEEKAD
ncbi:MAG: hypothetical protein GYB36_14185 [Alphaproteobacteria bacterium]|nr:hypothetical protein [Alphaproteobacteria bacterium]